MNCNNHFIRFRLVSKGFFLITKPNKLDALDKKELFKWIAYRLTDEKYDVKKELSNA